MSRTFAHLLSGLLLLTLSLPASAGFPLFDSRGEEVPTIAPMLEKVTPGVVNIATSGTVQIKQNPLFNDPFFRRFFDLPDVPRERQTQSLGSGVVVDAKNGYIITNHHVIANADEIRVTLRNGETHKAELIGTDPETDVAVIRIRAKNLVAIPRADSDTVRVGDFVVAIGNPFGLGQTVTSGIVSAKGRSGLGIEGYEDFIQTDASINPGNSGGALVNLRGQLIGINTAILSQSGGNIGIGFAIPINMAWQIMQHLITHGEVQRGRLGASAQDLTPELAQAFGIPYRKGAIITTVEPGSAAQEAGLKPGDIVTEVNGRPIRTATDLRNAIGLLRVGEKVRLKVLRDGKTLTLSATVARPALSQIDGEKLNPYLAGAVLTDIQENSPWYGKIEGVLVAEVAAGSPAWRSGLRKGDVIVSANRKPVANLGQLQEAVKGSRSLLLNIQRGNGSLFLFLR